MCKTGQMKRTHKKQINAFPCFQRNSMFKREKSLSVFRMHANQKLQSVGIQRSSLQICVKLLRAAGWRQFALFPAPSILHACRFVRWCLFLWVFLFLLWMLLTCALSPHAKVIHHLPALYLGLLFSFFSSLYMGRIVSVLSVFAVLY